MPPLFNEERRSQYIRLRRRSPNTATRPKLLIRESSDDGDDNGNDSDENISPDAEKSEIRFTLERRRFGNNSNNNDDDDDDDDNNQRNSRGGSRSDRFQRGKGGFATSAHQDTDGEEEDNNGGGGGGGGGRGNDNGDGNGNRHGSGNGDNGDNNGGGHNRFGGNHDGSNPSSDSNSASLPPQSVSSSTIATTSTVDLPVPTSATAIPPSDTILPSATQDSSISTSTTTPITSITFSTGLPTVSLTTTTSAGLDSSIPGEVSASSLTSPTATALFDSVTPLPTLTSTSLLSVPTTTTRGFRGSPDNSNNQHNGHGGFDRNKDRNRSGLDPTAERLLIGAGAIGAFIVLCFIGWLVYRSMKKSKQSGHNGSSGNWLSKKLPWRRRRAMNGVQVADRPHMSTEPPPIYDASNLNPMEDAGFYNQEKSYPLESGSMTDSSTVNIRNETALRQISDGQPPLADILGQHTLDRSDMNSTLRSRMPDPYYNQSELARQPSDAYNPAQRRVYRASELSSLSSGFGDGDIIMPPPNMMPKPPGAQTLSTNVSKFSWINKGEHEERRDTVYTTTSEDRPARFRSINSWVDQQKGRVKRASSRAKERGEVPVIPAIPGQVNVTQQTVYR
ncbi:hypothetical protein F5Y19DRAFT_132216 [Xylariaceae sp. FL1651]|nr:hypothetical protein F5Y19DRAFT_132216 [Xylariaceae sp. FL1651]